MKHNSIVCMKTKKIRQFIQMCCIRFIQYDYRKVGELGKNSIFAVLLPLQKIKKAGRDYPARHNYVAIPKSEFVLRFCAFCTFGAAAELNALKHI